MKIISWNVNGLRAALRKEAFGFLQGEAPDLLCLQETRLGNGEIDPVFPDYPFQYWNHAERKGYSGTAVFSRSEPLAVTRGMDIPEHDREGRVLTLELPDFLLVSVYTPNAQRDLARLEYRVRWDRDFRAWLKGLEKRKPVVFCGDLNVAHQEIDIADPRGNRGNAGFTDEERRGFGALLEAGFVDTFRALHAEGGHYSWWSFFGRAREKNHGWRIDYTCLSASLRPALKEAFILPGVTGSDHAPVGVVLE